jgi:anti-sigma regulatory factor (Ser/Thr protein kinase)
MSATSHSTGESRVLISETLHVFVVRRIAQQIASNLGFASVARAELAIVVSELATNILKYAGSGEIRLRPVDTPGLVLGLEIVAEDRGPPIKNLEMALLDGHGEHGPILPERQIGRGGIGAGLGAVIRLTDTFEYRPETDKKSFCAIRYLRRPRRT